ncbi:MAG: hypothetical protein IPJ81_15485 [Chitinophagaceae bacterium]|nr:hypothetical protein [Chitinophagaceae bacterium]
MLEILALIYFTKKIGILALQKGLKPGIWKLYTILAWFGAEIVGILIGFAAFGQENTIGAVLVGLACAVPSAFIVRSALNKKPDALDDDINKIGVRDLYP